MENVHINFHFFSRSNINLHGKYLSVTKYQGESAIKDFHWILRINLLLGRNVERFINFWSIRSFNVSLDSLCRNLYGRYNHRRMLHVLLTYYWKKKKEKEIATILVSHFHNNLWIRTLDRTAELMTSLFLKHIPNIESLVSDLLEEFLSRQEKKKEKKKMDMWIVRTNISVLFLFPLLVFRIIIDTGKGYVYVIIVERL